jgi:hypothetical protein
VSGGGVDGSTGLLGGATRVGEQGGVGGCGGITGSSKFIKSSSVAGGKGSSGIIGRGEETRGKVIGSSFMTSTKGIPGRSPQIIDSHKGLRRLI